MCRLHFCNLHTKSPMRIIQATIADINRLAPLFDGYRQFYKQPSNLEAAVAFLNQRFTKKDSVIFLAESQDESALGFTQLYPSFSSVSMQRTYILNDLFVDGSARAKGVATALMNSAKEFALQQGAKGLTLETDIDNPAQKLYERLGWKKDVAVLHYTWTAPITQ